MEHMEHGTVIPVDNETRSQATRTTQEGKQIRYCMNVLQQPQRARACGAGAKSSADRRPVDPPPIVELKIYEGDGTDRDITFNMNANYFLFATLEQARPMAHGRMPEEKTNRLVVLTGTPVAGMVYLDRPSPAGYFIFPDLSVRHEGKYRLSFSLYEELKDAKDNDKTDDPSRPPTPGNAHVIHRLEVKSRPFMVYSAKKFPGLTESTSLSRIVAEQGCRVRIRRDVRMRRRDNKKSGPDWDDYEEATAEARARVSATPDPTVYAPHPFMDPIGRPRSASNASHHSLPNPLSRRPSMQEMAQGYHGSLGAAPHTPQNGFGPTPPYGPSPTTQYTQTPYMQQPPPPPPMMQPPPPPSQYNPQHNYAPPHPMAAPAPPQPGYYNDYGPPALPSSSGQAPYHHPSNGYDSASQRYRTTVDYPSQAPHEQRRSSGHYNATSPGHSTFAQSTSSSLYSSYPPLPPPPPPPPPPPTYQPPPSPLHPSYSTHPPAPKDHYATRPPPLQPVQPPARANEATTPLSARSDLDGRMAPPLPPLQIPGDVAAKTEMPSPSSAAPAPAYYQTSSYDSLKRSFGRSFPSSERAIEQPLRKGARPITPHNGQIYGSHEMDNQDDTDVNNISRVLAYRRAGGTLCERTLARPFP
ncbi:hypothetical protein M433DRAFT_160594 [Acidomyces richmondensis BFW]